MFLRPIQIVWKPYKFTSFHWCINSLLEFGKCLVLWYTYFVSCWFLCCSQVVRCVATAAIAFLSRALAMCGSLLRRNSLWNHKIFATKLIAGTWNKQYRTLTFSNKIGFCTLPSKIRHENIQKISTYQDILLNENYILQEFSYKALHIQVL